LQSGDVLLLCSDGLWSPLDDEEIAEAFISKPQPTTLGRLAGKIFGAKTEELPTPLPVSAALEQLISKALKRESGRADNTTAVAVRWGETEKAHPTPVPVCEVLNLGDVNPSSDMLGRTQGATKGFSVN
jgi:serine/threonine protein phosphatase PrpC